jgi:beta-lactamase class A
MIKVCMLLIAVAVLAPDTLRGQIEQIARSAQGRVGAAVMVLETGKAIDFAGDQHFPMQSVYKLPIGMAVLHAVERGLLSLEQQVRVEPDDLVPTKLHSPLREKYPQGGVEVSVRQLLQYMVSQSDGTACDMLLRVIGGPAQVTSYLRGLDIQGIIVATSEKEMAQDEMVQYRNWATPKAVVELLAALQAGRGLSAASRTLLMQLMTETSTGPQRIKGLLSPTTTVAHKTGTSGTVKGLTRATNDVGLITLPDGKHLAIAVFVADSKANQAMRERVIAKIARAAWDWGR